MQDKEQKNYEFIKEKRKERPVNKKRMLIQATFVFAMALMFGVVASFVIAFLQPKIEAFLYPPEEPTTVSIPVDEPTETLSTEVVGTENANEENEQPINMTDWQPTIEDLQMLQNQLYAVGREANRFVVTVTGIQSNTDWFNNAYESKDQGSGIIIANNSQELLILTEKKVISNAQEVYVTFADETTIKASMKQYDGNTGIAILSVPLSEIEASTMQKISIAPLGSSLYVQQGTLTIAVGSPMGMNFSILTGNITSTTNTISTIDANYKIFTTDIVASESGSGALLNVKGEVIGLVMQDYSRQGDENTLTAVAISDLKALIENLSNNKEMAYLGLGISTVSSEIEKEYEIPRGVYIKEVKMDSPAMNAGLQSGDVITSINGQKVSTDVAFANALLALSPEETATVEVKRKGASEYVTNTYDVTIGVLQ